MRGEFEDGGGEGECHILTNLECNSVQQYNSPNSRNKAKKQQTIEEKIQEKCP